MLRNYHWPGNVRELEKAIKSALLLCEGELILPAHLPYRGMLPSEAEATNHHDTLPPELLTELRKTWPADPLKKTLTEIEEIFQQALDRYYLPRIWEQHDPNITAASKAIECNQKTFRARWKNADLPPLRGEEESAND